MLPTEHKRNIAGRSLFALEAGSGQPTVIFEAGLGDFSRTWHAIQAEVAKITRTISYDRAGRGQSQFAGENRTGEDCLADLLALLGALEVKEPVVFVGHSFGGFIARLFAHRYPEKVAGIVLVDSSQEDAVFEIRKILSELSFPPRRFDEPQWLTRLRFHQSQHLDPAFPRNMLNDEGVDFTAFERQMQEITSLGDVPLKVISSSKRTYDRDAGATGEFADAEKAVEQVWLECQTKLLQLSTNAEQVLATNSGHYIQDDQPNLVISSVIQMVEHLRREHEF